jgi:hypothetical protein
MVGNVKRRGEERREGKGITSLYGCGIGVYYGTL